MIDADATTLTGRQVEVLELRERGLTQREVAERIGTTDSNVSAIERAAEENVEKARRTLELVRTLRTPVQFSVEAGTTFGELVDEIYRRGDRTGTKIGYCRPELYTHLYGLVEDHADENRLNRPVTVGITSEGDVKAYPESP